MANYRHADRILAELRKPLAADRVPVVNSWRRCIETYGLDPHAPSRPTVLTSTELVDVRVPMDDLLALAHEEIDRLYLRLKDQGYLVTLANSSGVNLMMRCAESEINICRVNGVTIGGLWAEENQGTNGIGTCIKEGRPVSIVMNEHFSSDLLGLTCSVAPIRGAGQKISAALNVTTRQPTSHEMQSVVREIVRRSAARIENRYFERLHAARRVLRLSPHSDFTDLAWEARLAVDEAGRVVDATIGTAELLRVDRAAILGRPLDEVAGARLGTLLDGAPGPVQLRRDTDGSCVYLRALDQGWSRPGAGSRPREGRAPAGQVKANPAEMEALLGHDPVMAGRVRLAQRLVNHRLPILLQGETGTGKSRLAKLLHTFSSHASRQFAALNCAAISATLIESELFGYLPGAFTGAATKGSKGRLLEADGGTLFLDEIGDMPLQLQTKLLQVLSEGEFVPVGGTRPIRVEISVISASHRNIAELVREGRFREDLYFRLNGTTLELPPLRRRTDRQQLIEALLLDEATRAGRPEMRFEPAALQMLGSYHWPGNVRELQHVVRYAVAVAETDLVTRHDLPPPFDQVSNAGGQTGDRTAVDRQMLTMALEQARWNLSLAAKRLGISRTTLYRKLKSFGIAYGASDLPEA